MVAAQILSGYILGAPLAYGEIFSPARFNLPASTKTLIKDGTQSFKGLALSPSFPPGPVDDLSPGTGELWTATVKKLAFTKWKWRSVHCFTLLHPSGMPTGMES